MRRLLIVFALVLAALVPAAAKAQLPTFQLSQELLDFIAAAPASDDLAAGEGKFIQTQMGVSGQVTLSAHGTLTDARGSHHINLGGLKRRGDVECLFVSGKHAAASGTFDEPAFDSFDSFVFVVEDNGEPSENNPTPDRAEGFFLTEPMTGTDCGLAFVLSRGTAPIVQGNFVVMDRP